jgi:hypothetical protein
MHELIGLRGGWGSDRPSGLYCVHVHGLRALGYYSLGIHFLVGIDYVPVSAHSIFTNMCGAGISMAVL